MPSLTRAADVVRDVRAAGLDVELDVVGETRELPRALDLSAYRILQEGLTNVLKHAHASRADVEVGDDRTRCWSRCATTAGGGFLLRATMPVNGRRS